MKIAKYLSPQIYKSIFSGQKDVSIATERKKTHHLFFRHQGLHRDDGAPAAGGAHAAAQRVPDRNVGHRAEARRHAGQVHRRRHSGVLGDPETKGVEEDAKECMRMAIDMQRRLVDLNSKWRTRGVEQPFKVRMASTPAFAMSAISGRATAWTIRSSAPRRNLAARLQSHRGAGRHRDLI